MTGPDCVIAELHGGDLTADQLRQIERIFFEASGRVFASDEEQFAFRERWLGRYLQGGSDVLLVALDGQRSIAGYLVGALEDPAGQPRFADIAYFQGSFRDLCQFYPAHLHINLAPAFRGKGVGAGLVHAFTERAGRASAPGIHVVTGAQSRNVSFYQRCGFAPLRTTSWNGRESVFLGMRLTSAD